MLAGCEGDKSQLISISVVERVQVNGVLDLRNGLFVPS